jgi:putative oxidoreductase
MVKKVIQFVFKITSNLQSLGLLLIRLILAYNFYATAIVKWEDIQSVADWFESLNIPLAKFNAYFVATIEMLSVFLFAMGIATRLISLLLIPTILVAIYTVHWENGYAVGDNGYEIPLYYLSMLFVLLGFGSGKVSLNYFLYRLSIWPYKK